MLIRKNISLKPFNTFGLDYKTDCMVDVKNQKEAIAFFRREFTWKKPLLIVGGVSNILFTGDFKGTILRPGFGGIKVRKLDNAHVIISAGAGILWDKLVGWCVEKGYGGLENLSLIPGTVGAAPVQNIGAYGTEVRETILKVKTISIADGTTRIFRNEECEFGYRSSIFKTREKGKYLVTRVYFNLTLNPILNLNYGSLREKVSKTGRPTLKNVRQAVTDIRKSKLPDPLVIGNAGSFFKNPVVNRLVVAGLKNNYPSIPFYEDPSGNFKLAAGWLIEQCGWKGKRIGDAGVHDKQSLVLVNYGKATGKEIYDLSEMIKFSVLEKFGIELDREVEVI